MMVALWELNTQGDVLATVRAFLGRLWEAAGLDGLLLPVYHEGEPYAAPKLITRKDSLAQADPFVPILPYSTAAYAAEFAHKHPWMYFGVVLRACEGRALKELVQRGTFHLDNWLTIGVDCLASYPLEDLEWRLKKTGSLELLTRESLRFARQGGIALYRYRQACQMCDSHAPQLTDVTLGILGLPTSHMVLIGVQDESLAHSLNLESLVNGKIPSQMLLQREQTLQAIKERRDRVYDRVLSELPDHYPLRMSELIAWLKACEPCRRCLEVCPVYNGVLDMDGNGGTVAAEDLFAWLGSCAACGMCEQACPAGRPLTVIHSRLKRELIGKIAALNL